MSHLLDVEYVRGLKTGEKYGSHDAASLVREIRQFPRDLQESILLDKRRELEAKKYEGDRLKKENARLEKELEFIRGFIDWIEGPMRLERPQASVAHRIAQKLKDGQAHDGDGAFRKTRERLRAFGTFNPISFVVEHDWAAAFANAQDLKQTEAPAPFESTLYEFRISGRAVCVWECEAGWAVFAEHKGMWIIGDHADPDVSGLERLLRDQINAIKIALDAEVVVKDIIRAPHKLNVARSKIGKLPLFDYHVLRLKPAQRAARILSGADGSEPPTRKRLHFVRGHWRHFENHKTWVRWHLRGDPDLGFIDKHYRL